MRLFAHKDGVESVLLSNKEIAIRMSEKEALELRIDINGITLAGEQLHNLLYSVKLEET